MRTQRVPAALLSIMVIGILLSLVCGLLGLTGVGLVASYHPGESLLILGWCLFAAGMTAPAVFQSIMWWRLARGAALKGMPWLAALCGIALAIFGSYFVLADSGDWFVYAVFALAGLALLTSSFGALRAERRSGVI